MSFNTVTLPIIAPDVTRKHAFPKIPALHANEMYFTSKQVEKIPIGKLQWEYISSPMKLRSLKGKLELEMITNKLCQKRQEFAKVHKRMATHMERLDKIDRHVDEIQQKIINMKKLLQERTEAVEELTEDIVKMMDIKCRFKAKIEEYGFYEEYLSFVVIAEPWKYKCPKDIIRRYNDLRKNKDEIAADQEGMVKNLLTTQDEFKKMIHQRHMQLIGHRNVIDHLLDRYENAKYSSLRSEALIESVKQEAKEKRIESGFVRDACWKMYQHMQWKNFTDTDFKKDNFKGQLRVINNTLGLLRDIHTKVNLREKNL